jgi:hypothetical protein
MADSVKPQKRKGDTNARTTKKDQGPDKKRHHQLPQ